MVGLSEILWLQLLKLVELEGTWEIIKFHSVVWAIRKLKQRERDLPRFLVSSKRQIWLTEGVKNFLRGHWATGRNTGKAEDKALKIKGQKWFAVIKAMSEILSQNLYVEGFNAGDCALYLVLLPLLTSLPLQHPLERGWCYCCFASTFRLDSPHPVLWVTSSRLMCVLRAPIGAPRLEAYVPVGFFLSCGRGRLHLSVRLMWWGEGGLDAGKQNQTKLRQLSMKKNTQLVTSWED